MKRIRTISVISAISFLLLTSCHNSDIRIVDAGKDSTISAKKVSIKWLAKNYQEMHGKFVELKGKFSFNFEDVAIYDYGLFSNSKTCFWLDFAEQFGSSEDLEKLSGKKVTVKGRINANDTGHMGYYLATLEDVYYMAQE